MSGINSISDVLRSDIKLVRAETPRQQIQNVERQIARIDREIVARENYIANNNQVINLTKDLISSNNRLIDLRTEHIQTLQESRDLLVESRDLDHKRIGLLKESRELGKERIGLLNKKADIIHSRYESLQKLVNKGQRSKSVELKSANSIEVTTDLARKTPANKVVTVEKATQTDPISNNKKEGLSTSYAPTRTNRFSRTENSEEPTVSTNRAARDEALLRMVQSSQKNIYESIVAGRLSKLI